MHKFEKSTIINCDIEDLYEFHLDLNNLKRITSSDIKVELLSENIKPKLNSKIKIKVYKFFIPISWEIKIVRLEKPNILVDLALKSPFLYWEHQHIFKKHENGVILQDIVNFKLPYGFLGRLFIPLIVKDLEKMFNFRHNKTKKAMEKVIN